MNIDRAEGFMLPASVKWVGMLFCCYLLNSFTVLASGKTDSLAIYDRLIVNYRFSIPDSGIYYAQKGLELSIRLNDKKAQGRMLNHWGIIDENQGRFDMARQKYLRAIKAFREINFSEGIADETIRLGVTEMRKANFEKATAYFFDALKIHEGIHNPRGIMECNITLGEAYMGQMNWLVARGYLKRAEGISKRLPLMGLTLYIYYNLGVVYKETGDIPKAISYFQKGVNLSNEPQYAGIHVTLLNGLGMAYAKQGDTRKAAGLQLEALKQARQIKNYLRELQALNGLADTYSKNDPDKAIDYLQQALALANQKMASKLALDALKRLAVLYEQKGDYRRALKYSKAEHAVGDSMYNINKSTEIANLQANYDLQSSRASVEKLEFLNREQKNQQKIIILITAAVALVLVILAYFLVRMKMFNKQLKQLNAELLSANNVKDKVFSVIGHDLRSPLATVKNFLGLLEDDDLTEPEKKQVIADLSANCDASLDVLNKLLKWGQLQLKGQVLNPTVFNPLQVINENLQLFNNALDNKHLTVHVRVDEHLMLEADRDHFDFIIRNLLSNAIKFTPTGGRIMIGSVEGNDNRIAFYIRDNGIGMPPLQVADIFNHINVSHSGTKGEKGTGLGLMLSKEYAEANGGTISVESTEGKGSTFTFTMAKA